MLTDDDNSALLALLTRYTRIFMENTADLQLKAELDARMAGKAAQFAQLHGAFSIFGFQTNVEGGFAKIKEAVGPEAYALALRKAGWSRPSGNSESTNSDSNSLSQKDNAAVDAKSEMTGDEPSYTVRELVLEKLKGALTSGCKAAEIRSYIETTRSTKLHDKTVGMTLYRLACDGMARREGRIWFFVPPKTDTKSPGGETLGGDSHD